MRKIISSGTIVFLERKEKKKKTYFPPLSSLAEYVEVAGRSCGILRMEKRGSLPTALPPAEVMSPAKHAGGSKRTTLTRLLLEMVRGRRQEDQSPALAFGHLGKEAGVGTASG